MAFASGGTVGTATGATNEATSVITTATNNMAVGDLCVVCFAMDNHAAADGDEGAVSGVVDNNVSGTNKWFKAAEWCNAQGAAAAGCTISVWYCNLAYAIPTGRTITATLTSSADRDATSSTAWNFTLAAGNKAQLVARNHAAHDGVTDIPSLDCTTANLTLLRIRAIAIEYGSTTAAMTPTSGWTQFTAAQGGTTAAGSAVKAEFHISSGTGDASDPTGTLTAADMASVYVAFQEVPTLPLETWRQPAGGVVIDGGNNGHSGRILCGTGFADNVALVAGNDSGGTRRVRVTFRACDITWALDHASIGVSNGTTMQTTATPVELLFSGAHGFSIAAYEEITSDWVTIPAFTTGSVLVVVIDQASGNSGAGYSNTCAGTAKYWLAATASYNSAAPAGSWTTSTKSEGIYRIELEAILTGTAAVTEPADTVASTGAIGVTGALAITEPADTVAVSGSVVVTGTLAVTEPADTVAIDGTGAINGTGTLAVTEPADTVAASGQTVATGALDVAEPADTVSVSGQTIATGTLALADLLDGVAASAVVITTGTLAITEPADAVAASGQVIATGTQAIDEPADAVSITGAVIGTGALAIDEPPDAAAFAGQTVAAGTCAATDPIDTVSAVGNTIASGNCAIGDPIDAISVSGQTVSTGTMAVDEPADMVVVSGLAGAIGAIVIADPVDAASSDGVVENTAAPGALAILEPADQTAFTGLAITSGQFAELEPPDIAEYHGQVFWDAFLAATDPLDTAEFSGQTIATGILGLAEPSDTSVNSGLVITAGTLALDDLLDEASSSGQTIASGTLDSAEPADTVSATGAEEVSGLLALDDPDDILSLSSSVVGIFAASDPIDVAQSSGNVSQRVFIGWMAITEPSDAILMDSLPLTASPQHTMFVPACQRGLLVEIGATGRQIIVM